MNEQINTVASEPWTDATEANLPKTARKADPVKVEGAPSQEGVGSLDSAPVKF